MGLSDSWLAVKGKPSEELLAEMRLSPTGARCDLFEASYSATTLRNGWFLLILRRRLWEDLLPPETRARLSLGCELAGCFMEEHVMASSAELWRDGALIWRATHLGEQGEDHIAAEGSLPDAYPALLGAAEAALAGDAEKDDDFTVDYHFDIPVRLAEGVTGFAFDRAHEEIETQGLEVLVPPPEPAKKPFWRFW